MTLQEQIRSNRLRTVVVWLGFLAIIAAIVLAVWGLYSPGLAGVLGAVGIIYGLIAYRESGRMVASVAHASPISRADAPELWHVVDTAAIASGLARTPDIYIVDDPAPNAFAAGRSPDTAYVAATTGLLTMLNERELQGVMAHELSHVRNRDVQLMTLAAVLTGSIVLLCDILMRVTLFGGGRRRGNDGGNIVMVVIGLVVIVLAPIMAGLMQMALSRRREYLADATAAEITGDPEGLAMALQKLADDVTPMQHVTRATAHMYIESPLRDHEGLRSSLGGMFDTHPPLEERIRRLNELAGIAAPPAT